MGRGVWGEGCGERGVGRGVWGEGCGERGVVGWGSEREPFTDEINDLMYTKKEM